MSLVKYQPVKLDEVLCHLMARTNAASTMGMQLEQARAIYHGGPAHSAFGTANEMHVKAPLRDVSKAQERAETAMLENISVSKCVDALGQVRVARVLKERPALAKLQKACPDRGQGELVVMCLRAYGEYAGLAYGTMADKDQIPKQETGEPPRRSEHRALAAVYDWAARCAPKLFPPPEHEEASLGEAFRFGQAKAARAKAAELYADAFLVVAEWVVVWNQRRSGFDSIGRKRGKVVWEG